MLFNLAYIREGRRGEGGLGRGGGVGAYIRDVNWVLYLGMPIFGREGGGLYTGHIYGIYTGGVLTGFYAICWFYQD